MNPTDRPSGRVAVVGGGLMGVVLASDLAAQGRSVVLYEAADRLGGLSTFDTFGDMQWDRFYHCVLPTDRDLLAWLRELGLGERIRWARTSTGVYIDGTAYPLDTALDFARFSALSLIERARLAWTLVRCALVRDVRSLEGTTAEEWFVRIGGERPYRRIWLPLLRAKFGEAADRVSPVFLVAKVKRMLTARSDLSGTENLGYVSGGYRTVWERAGERLGELGVEVRLSSPVESVDPCQDGATVEAGGRSETFERVLLTVPFESARRLCAGWPGRNPVPSLARVEYMGLVCLVLALRREVFPNYVMNIADPGFPFTGVIGMTNLVDPAEVGGHSLAYVPAYVPATDPLMTATDDEVFARAFEGLARIYPDLVPDDIEGWWVRRAEIVQPVQGIGYSHDAPQPDFACGPVTVVNNSQLLETDLNNSRVIAHAHEAAASLLRTGLEPCERTATGRPEPPAVRFVLPAHNEEASIRALVERIADAMRGDGRTFDVTVVDDGSTDGTADAALALSDAIPVIVVRHERNLGLGAAMRTGLRTAAEASGPDDVIITMDADLTHDPRFAVRMLDRYHQGCDVVIASRFRRGSLEIGVSPFRRLLTRGARLFYGTLVPVPGVRDYSCGYRLYSAAVVSLAFDRLGNDFITEPGFACMVEIIGKLRRLADCCEIPFVLHYEEKRTASQMRIWRTVAAYLRVVTNVWRLDVSGRLGDRPRPSAAAYWSLVGSVALSVLGQALLKTGMAGGVPTSLAGAVATAPLLVGLACYACSAVLWLGVLAQLDLSVAYPMGAISYPLVLLVSLAMGEHVPPLRWLGVLAIVAGIALIGLGSGLRTARRTP